MERQAASRSVLPSAVLRHALVRSRVLLLEARDLQNGVGISQFDFTGEWHIVGSSPADPRNWTVGGWEEHRQLEPMCFLKPKHS